MEKWRMAEIRNGRTKWEMKLGGKVTGKGNGENRKSNLTFCLCFFFTFLNFSNNNNSLSLFSQKNQSSKNVKKQTKRQNQKSEKNQKTEKRESRNSKEKKTLAFSFWIFPSAAALLFSFSLAESPHSTASTLSL
jgi:hypothetical protein